MPSVITVSTSGKFSRTDRFLHGIIQKHYMNKLERYAQKGVELLKEATPKDTGRTADAWSYEIEEKPGLTTIYWRNDHVEKGVNIAILIRYGHGTRNGGFVEGRDFIEPTMRPLFDDMAKQVWREVVG